MKVVIGNREKNVLLKREEVSFNAEDTRKTPSRKELRGQLAALVNAKEDQIVVGKLNQAYGQGGAAGHARIYSDAEALHRIENRYMVERNFGKAGEKAGGKPAAEGKPKEEKGGEGKEAAAEKKSEKKDAKEAKDEKAE